MTAVVFRPMVLAILVVQPDPAHDAVFVAPLRRQVEPIEGAQQEFAAAAVGGVGVENPALRILGEYAGAR